RLSCTRACCTPRRNASGISPRPGSRRRSTWRSGAAHCSGVYCSTTSASRCCRGSPRRSSRPPSRSCSQATARVSPCTAELRRPLHDSGGRLPFLGGREPPDPPVAVGHDLVVAAEEHVAEQPAVGQFEHLSGCPIGRRERESATFRI